MQKVVCCLISSTESKNSIGTVGLIGVGTMGKCMVECMSTNGFQVAAYDIVSSALQYAEQKGAIVVDSPMEIAKRANLVIMSLPAAKQVFDVVEGEKGLLEALTSEHVIVDTSTVSPETSKRAAQIVAAKGSEYIDAPILGRPSAAGNWMLPAGGSEKAIESVKPVLNTFAKQVVRVGDVGAGNAFKLLNQLMFSVINAVSAEVMALTEVVGIDKKTFYDVVANSGAATVSGLFKETGRKIVSEDFDNPTFTVELLCKDAALAIQMAKNCGITPLIAGFVQILNENTKGKGFAKKDTSAIVKVFSEHYSKIDL